MKFYRYILKRILQTIPLLFIVSIISFFIIRLSPVDPLAELKLNPSILCFVQAKNSLVLFPHLQAG